MPDVQQIAGYAVSGTELPADTTLFDKSVIISLGPTVWQTQSHPYSQLKGIIASKIGVDMSTTGVIALDRKCSAKSVVPYRLEIINTTSAAGLGDIEIRLQKNGGIGDILKGTTLTNFAADGNWNIFIMGALPQLLIDSDTINLEKLIASSGANVCDFLLYGGDRDV